VVELAGRRPRNVRSTPGSEQSDITAQARRAVCAIFSSAGFVGAGGLTNIIKITVMTFLMLAVAHAQAAEPTVITLSCDGKLTNSKVRNAKQESITKMDLVVNFAERTVSFSGHLAGIDNADVAHISFSGENNAVHGEINRVTGITWATADTNAATFVYNLLCSLY
jgi:hypothetical protein